MTKIAYKLPDNAYDANGNRPLASYIENGMDVLPVVITILVVVVGIAAVFFLTRFVEKKRPIHPYDWD